MQRAGAPGSIMPIADCHLQDEGANAILRLTAAALRAPPAEAPGVGSLTDALQGLVIRRGTGPGGEPSYMAILQTRALPPAPVGLAAAGAAWDHERQGGVDRGGHGGPMPAWGRASMPAGCSPAERVAVEHGSEGAPAATADRAAGAGEGAAGARDVPSGRSAGASALGAAPSEAPARSLGGANVGGEAPAVARGAAGGRGAGPQQVCMAETAGVSPPGTVHPPAAPEQASGRAALGGAPEQALGGPRSAAVLDAVPPLQAPRRPAGGAAPGALPDQAPGGAAGAAAKGAASDDVGRGAWAGARWLAQQLAAEAEGLASVVVLPRAGPLSPQTPKTES